MSVITCGVVRLLFGHCHYFLPVDLAVSSDTAFFCQLVNNPRLKMVNFLNDYN
jgi:hypothetical protein